MAYIVEPLLATLSDEITRGLANGSLQRWGGIIRVTKGYPGAGEIVTHLRDVVSVASQVSTPASAANLVSSVAANVQLHQVSSQLSQVMQLTQVAAAASVLNLGVSAVGFAVMNHKLNRLQESVGKLDGRLVQLAADNSRRFDDIDGKLVELRYLVTGERDTDRMTVSRIRDHACPFHRDRECGRRHALDRTRRVAELDLEGISNTLLGEHVG